MRKQTTLVAIGTLRVKTTHLRKQSHIFQQTQLRLLQEPSDQRLNYLLTHHYFITFSATVKTNTPKVLWVIQSSDHPQYRLIGSFTEARGDSFDCCTEMYAIVVLLSNSEHTETSSQPKHMLWILKRIVLMRWFF